MAATTKIFQNIADNLEADNINGFNLENNNLIENATISLDSSDNSQTAYSVTNFISFNGYYESSKTNDDYELKIMNKAQLIPFLNEGMHFNFKSSESNSTTTPRIIFPSFPPLDLVAINGISLQKGQIVEDQINECILTEFEGTLKCILLNELPLRLATAHFKSTIPTELSLGDNFINWNFTQINNSQGIVVNGTEISIANGGIYRINLDVGIGIQNEAFYEFILNVDLLVNDIPVSSNKYALKSNTVNNISIVLSRGLVIPLRGFHALDTDDIIKARINISIANNAVVILNPIIQVQIVNVPSNIFIKMERVNNFNLENIWVDEFQEPWVNEFGEPWANI